MDFPDFARHLKEVNMSKGKWYPEKLKTIVAIARGKFDNVFWSAHRYSQGNVYDRCN